MSQEQPLKHVQDTIRELNAQEAASHEQNTATNPHSNVVATQKEPIGVQVRSLITRSSILNKREIGQNYKDSVIFCE